MQTNSRKQILWITQTALLLALTVAVQYYVQIIVSDSFISQIITGSLVNLFLVLSTLLCGFLSGFSISVITPVIALFIGRLPHFYLIPFVILGNIAIVFIFWLVSRKNIVNSNFTVCWGIASITGSLLKFGVLWLGVTQIFLKVIPQDGSVLKPKQIAMLNINFSFPQLATALLGCILAYAIYPVLKKAVIDSKPINVKIKN